MAARSEMNHSGQLEDRMQTEWKGFRPGEQIGQSVT